ncbi:PLP-dependent aminotransferase family protein [Actinomycetaceae bacterium TAE3-ERU4]|nr:PLP-dependent aminotransferase family protein [Actinomycetaceae bacterium TAE3-ERU4]
MLVNPDTNYTFAQREMHFRPSPVRAVFETAMQPGMLSVAGGNPDLSLLDMDAISSLLSSGAIDPLADIFQYGSGAGTDGARVLSAALMSWGGAEYDIDEIQITSGSQAGLDAVTKLLCDPGDIILAEAPTYVGVLGTFGAYQVEVRQVPIDAHGLDPARVEEAIKQAHSEGRKVRYLYTISAYQNPSGVCLSPERHKRLIEVCANHGVWVVEDDAYGLLGFPRYDSDTPLEGAVHLPGGATPQPRLPMLAATSHDWVIHLGSYSKIFSPGARVGWIAAPKPVRERLQIACESVCITPSVIAQDLVERYVGTSLWQNSLNKQRKVYAERCSAAVKACQEYLPEGSTWEVPQGGFFLWVKLPEGQWGDVLTRGLKHKVVAVPGSGCYVDSEPGTHIRIAFSAVPAEKINESIARLGVALH